VSAERTALLGRSQRETFGLTMTELAHEDPRVLVLDADDDRQLGVRIADIGLDVARVDCRQVGIEIAGLRIGSCPRIVRHAHLPSSLRSRGEQSHSP